ncbi:hypothetical protein CVT24_004528 [Panaeolus cyanescens]|uniref:mRNA stability protein n=1 Tax=Panaeolus cyanescens TaxID=181874 RepID=A0A409YBS5_9AGAR|nr:hypothetical protein CVT24_004528 [Panaeolus cyanescens]
MRSRITAALTESVKQLSGTIGEHEDSEWPDLSMDDDRTAFNHCMHYIYTRNMRRPLFKTSTVGLSRDTQEQSDLDFEFRSTLPVDTTERSDEVDLFDDGELILSDAEAIPAPMDDWGSLETGSNDSSQTTLYDLEYEIEASALSASHTNWSQDARSSQKLSACPLLGMDLDTTGVDLSSIKCTTSSPDAAFDAVQGLSSGEDPARLHFQKDPLFDDDTTFIDSKHEARTKDYDSYMLNHPIRGSPHASGNVHLFDLVLRHESETGVVALHREGHGVIFVAGHTSSEDPTLSYFDGEQDCSHASQSYASIDNAPHTREISQPARCQSQESVELDEDFSVIIYINHDTFYSLNLNPQERQLISSLYPFISLLQSVMLPFQRNKVDISKLSPQEQQLFAKYGKLPTHKNVLMKMQKERKYFDSGDYALSKAGVAPQNTVGTAIPNPENIPHASTPGNGHNSHQGLSISPTNSTSSIAKESGLAHSDATDAGTEEQASSEAATTEPGPVEAAAETADTAVQSTIETTAIVETTETITTSSV